MAIQARSVELLAADDTLPLQAHMAEDDSAAWQRLGALAGRHPPGSCAGSRRAR